jgi:ribosomal protein S18 acetylase RimI-like enzyme
MDLPAKGVKNPTVVRAARQTDLDGIVTIGGRSFAGLRDPDRAREWVAACWRAHPRTRYFVAVRRAQVIGYILWIEKGGFRDEAIVELEQVAVDPAFRGQGVGSELIRSSLAEVERAIEARGGRIKVVEVTTRAEQGAIEIYRRVLGATIVATLSDHFRGPECLLTARPPFPGLRTPPPVRAPPP